MPYLMQMNGKGVMADGWELGEKPTVFGRGEDADVTIGDGAMSRRHFAITYREGRHEVTDLGSANGISLNDEIVETGSLKAGDVVQAGKTKFYYDIGMDTMVGQQKGLGTEVRRGLKELYAELE